MPRPLPSCTSRLELFDPSLVSHCFFQKETDNFHHPMVFSNEILGKITLIYTNSHLLTTPTDFFCLFELQFALSEEIPEKSFFGAIVR